MGPIINSSAVLNAANQSQYGDNLNEMGKCGNGSPFLKDARGNPIEGRCGYGPRLPLLVISPWAKVNFVDNSTTDQSSIIRFVEDNWLNGQRVGGGSFDAVADPINSMFNFGSGVRASRLLLDPDTGNPRE